MLNHIKCWLISKWTGMRVSQVWQYTTQSRSMVPPLPSQSTWGNSRLCIRSIYSSPCAVHRCLVCLAESASFCVLWGSAECSTALQGNACSGCLIPCSRLPTQTPRRAFFSFFSWDIPLQLDLHWERWESETLYICRAIMIQLKQRNDQQTKQHEDEGNMSHASLCVERVAHVCTTWNFVGFELLCIHRFVHHTHRKLWMECFTQHLVSLIPTSTAVLQCRGRACWSITLACLPPVVSTSSTSSSIKLDTNW